MPKEKIVFKKNENDLGLISGDEVTIKLTSQGKDFLDHLFSLGFNPSHNLKVSKIDGKIFYLFDKANNQNYSITLDKNHKISMYLKIFKRKM